MKESWSSALSDLLQKYGIDPIYFATILLLFLTFFYRNELKRSEKLKGHQKAWIYATFFGTVILVIISFLRLMGLLSL